MKQIYLVLSLYEKEKCLYEMNVNTKETNERLTNWLVSFSFPEFLCAAI